MTKPIITTAAEAVSVIKDKDRIYVHGIAATPMPLLNALSKRTELRDVELMHIHLENDNPCSHPGLVKSFKSINLFVGKHERPHVYSGRSLFIPIFLSEIPKLMRSGRLAPNVAMINVSPPDKHGYCSLGVEVTCAFPAVQTAKVIIAQINKNVPRTHGDSMIHYSSIDYAIEQDDPLPVTKIPPTSAVETQIGRNIAMLIKDGSTLQMGIGAIPNAVLASLSNHKDLGVHTEMFQDDLIPLIEKGIVNNSKKEFMKGKTLTSFVMGSKALYDFVDDNPHVAFLDSSITNDPVIIARNPRVIAINSAVEIDFTGQVCADSIGSRIISSVGGQLDFERGASIAKEGVPIITMPSTTKKGDSKIVPLLKHGSGVVTTRSHVHWVVTEYGAVNLWGLNTHQRASALINIAHPKHRENLLKEAYNVFHVDVENLELPPLMHRMTSGKLAKNKMNQHDINLLMGNYSDLAIDSPYYSIVTELKEIERGFLVDSPATKKPLRKSNTYTSVNEKKALPKLPVKGKSTNNLKTPKKTSSAPEKERQGNLNGDSELYDMVANDILAKEQSIKWDDIAGLADAKELLREAVVLPLLIPDFFKGIRRPWKGVCLYGPPGTGKTLLAKALSSEIGTTFFNVSASTLASKWKGDSEKLVRILFEMAREKAPSVIFIDEIDSLCSSRGGATEHESSRRMKTEILVQMDGLSSDQAKFVVVIAATNFPWDLDEALRRRLEKRVYIPLPSFEGRMELLKSSLKDILLNNINFEDIASTLEGYSGADIANICRDAALMVLRRKIKGLNVDAIKKLDSKEFNDPLEMKDFKDAIRKIKPSVSVEDVKRYENWTMKFGSS